MILIDTHVLIWLYLDQVRRIPPAVQRRLTRNQLGVSPFVELELSFMHEIGRLNVTAKDIIDDLSPKLELSVVDIAASSVCRAAADLAWTSDPFDRLIAAHATVSNFPLITRDELMRRHLPLAWWSD